MSSKIRMSGLISGLDTESIISQLVEVKKTKVTTATNEQTKLSWKQDIWKDLNKDLQGLQSKLSNLRFASSYGQKTTSVSNSTKASVITGTGATNSVQTLQVKKLAKSGYLTGAQLSTDKSYTAMSKLSDLGWTGTGNGKIEIAAGDKKVSLDVNADTTISDVLTSLKSAGLNASFDATNQRFFVSSTTTGKASDFSITASDSNGYAALNALGLTTKLSADNDTATYNAYKSLADKIVRDGEGNVDRDATIAKLRSGIDTDIENKKNTYLDAYKAAAEKKASAQQTIDELGGKGLKSVAEYEADLETAQQNVSDLKEQLEGMDESDPAYAEKQAELTVAEQAVDDLNAAKAEATSLANAQTALADAEATMEDIAGEGGFIKVTATDDGDGGTTYTAEARDKLTAAVEQAHYDKVIMADTALKNSGSGATKVSGQDAVIMLNGAEFTNNTNTFAINGLTITALSETAENESVTLTTQDDTDGVYDMIKDVLKQYNTVVNKLDKLYNADSAKGYNPLSDEEKDAMSETEAEKYEQKIKDSLLRGDSTVSAISSALNSIASSGFTVGGKTMYLADFGISTLSYFTASDNEKHALHINGDSDDENTSGEADKLKSMIASDSKTVVDFFTQLSQSLYKKMTDLSSSRANYRTFGTFYEDIKMKSDYTSYTSKISDLEEKMNDYEDKLYDQYSAMETALAKLQSNSSALSGLLGS